MQGTTWAFSARSTPLPTKHDQIEVGVTTALVCRHRNP